MRMVSAVLEFQVSLPLRTEGIRDLACHPVTAGKRASVPYGSGDQRSAHTALHYDGPVMRGASFQVSPAAARHPS